MARGGIVEEREATAAPARRGRLRRLVATFPRAVWVLSLANAILWTGRGMTIPFVFIYFNEIAGLPASVVGGAMTVGVIASSALALGVARQINQRGPQLLLLLSILGLAATTAVYPWATTIPAFLLLTSVSMVADQVYWPSVNSMTVPLADPARITEALTLLRCSFIAGVGLGSLLGGALVSGGGVAEYQRLYLLSVGVILVAALIVWRGVPRIAMPREEDHDDAGDGSWRALARDKLYVGTLGLFVVILLGYTQLQASVPAFLHREAGISEGTIGVLFTVKMLVVLAIQLPAASVVNRGNLGRLLAVSSVCFGLGLGAVFFAITGDGTTAFGFVVLVFVLFTLGEVIFAPATSITPVRLAPLHARGHYFTAQSIVWSFAWGVASLVAGVALDSPLPELVWPVLAGLMVGAAVWAWWLRGEERLAAGREG